MTEISSVIDPGQQSKVIAYTQVPDFPNTPSTANDV
jgi:hypothetical protein